MPMSRVFLVLVAVAAIAAQPARPGAQGRVIPRPPAPPPGANTAEAGSAAPDGYAPIPAVARPDARAAPGARTSFSVETVATGLAGAFSFHFLPDGRIIVGERPGRIRIVGKDGKPSEPLGGTARTCTPAARRVCSRCCRIGTSPRTAPSISTTPRCQRAPNPAKAPRLAGVLQIARARLSDDRRVSRT